jgi:hypothetical protein
MTLCHMPSLWSACLDPLLVCETWHSHLDNAAAPVYRSLTTQVGYEMD